MTFSIESKYEISDSVVLNNQIEATVLNMQLTLFDNYYRISYLLEFENGERRWTDENQISSKVESED